MFGSFIDILLVLTGSAYVPGTAWLVPGYMVILAFAYAFMAQRYAGRPVSREQLRAALATLRRQLATAPGPGPR